MALISLFGIEAVLAADASFPELAEQIVAKPKRFQLKGKTFVKFGSCECEYDGMRVRGVCTKGLLIFGPDGITTEVVEFYTLDLENLYEYAHANPQCCLGFMILGMFTEKHSRCHSYDLPDF